jgi:hypothetical protein
MGVDFVALMSHQFDNSNILSVPDFLNADKELCQALSDLKALKYTESSNLNWYWEALGARWIDKNPEAIWQQTERDPKKPEIYLAGPTFFCGIGRATCRISSSLRWYTIINSMGHQNAMRRVCHAIAGVFHGDKAIYIPDNGWQVCDAGYYCCNAGFTFQQTQSWLLKTCGPPAESLNKAQALMLDNRIGGYFLDDFKDLETSSGPA